MNLPTIPDPSSGSRAYSGPVPSRSFSQDPELRGLAVRLDALSKLSKSDAVHNLPTTILQNFLGGPCPCSFQVSNSLRVLKTND